MRILHVITSLYTGGAEKLMVDLLPRFRKMGIEADLALFNGSDTPFHRQLEAAGVRIIDFSKGGSVYSPMHIFRLRRLLRNYDIIHTHNYSPQLFGAIAALGKKVKAITTEHNTSNRRRNKRYFLPLDRWMYRRYDRIISISDKAQSNLTEYLNLQNLPGCVIYNGIDVARYCGAKPSDFFRENFGGNIKTIIQVAGFRWEKDQDTLIKALILLPAEFHLMLVGDGVRRSELEQLAAEENVASRVHFLGVRTDVPELLKAADYVVMSSHFEGLSLSSVEGMSVGKPFLASDVDGLREVVEGAGLLFPQGDSRSFADEILRLESDASLRSLTASRCRERASHYDISVMAEKYANLYQQLVKQ